MSSAQQCNVLYVRKDLQIESWGNFADIDIGKGSDEI